MEQRLRLGRPLWLERLVCRSLLSLRTGVAVLASPSSRAERRTVVGSSRGADDGNAAQPLCADGPARSVSDAVCRRSDDRRSGPSLAANDGGPGSQPDADDGRSCASQWANDGRSWADDGRSRANASRSGRARSGWPRHNLAAGRAPLMGQAGSVLPARAAAKVAARARRSAGQFSL